MTNNEAPAAAITPEQLARYPYFTAWLAELKRLPEEVANIQIERGMKEVLSATQWKYLVPTDDFTAKLIFKSGEVLSRAGTFSDGTMLYI